MSLLVEYAKSAIPVSGGTDLIPNMKHRFLTPAPLVTLTGIGALKGIRKGGRGASLPPRCSPMYLGILQSDFTLRRYHRRRDTSLGPSSGTPAPWAGTSASTPAARITTSPTSRGRRCDSCLKKDGDICYVTRVGKKCVAAHSADTPPVLMTLGAQLDFFRVPPGTERCW